MKQPRPDRLPSDTEEVSIKPDFDNQLSVRIERSGCYQRERAHAVTVHGDGRIEYHDEPIGSRADDHERMKAAITKMHAAQNRADIAGKQAHDYETDAGAWHSVWLHGNWKFLTQKMTTAQRELAAAAVERYNAEHGDPDDDPINVRWWDE